MKGKSGLGAVGVIVVIGLGSLLFQAIGEFNEGGFKKPAPIHFPVTDQPTFIRYGGTGESMRPLLWGNEQLTLVDDWNGVESGHIIFTRRFVHKVEYVKRDVNGNLIWARTRGINNREFDSPAIRERDYIGTVVEIGPRVKGNTIF